jgi:Raf kinase inhibitor-like YbhB/YbcL family protein
MLNFLKASLILAVLGAAPALAQQQAAPAQQTPRPPPMTLSVPAYPDGGQFPIEFSQLAPGAAKGGGTSPEIDWQNVPAGTKSFVLHFHDIDVVRDKTTEDQLQWLVWNIPGTATGLPQGQPNGAQLPDGSYQGSASGAFYRGPGGGPVFHHYVMELFALDTTLDVKPADDAFASRKAVMDAMQGHILARTSYVALFKRPG